MMKMAKLWAAATMLVLAGSTQADDAAIRRIIAERIPDFPPIEEISKTPVSGLFELRVNGSEIFYTDAEGSVLIQGSMFDTRLRRNLTDDRIEKLSAIAFDALPLKDAFTIVRGNGKRKVAVFEDPNCGYCKRFERDLQKVDNVTVYMFLMPILSADSNEKSKAIWCANDKGKTWQDWMVRDVAPTGSAGCDTSPLERNVALGRKHHITGTPTLVFTNNTRVPGAISSQQVEQALASIQN